MQDIDKKIRTWCFAGFITLVLLGSALHFVFGWTNQSKVVGLFVPVNESVWEHLKMGYWALIIFSIAEFTQIRKYVNNYFLAKALGFSVLTFTIPIIFYTYTSFTGKNLLWVDISSFVLGALFCQLLTYRIYHLNTAGRIVNMVSLAYFVAIGILFAKFTYSPPHLNIFKDSRDTIRLK